MVHDVILDAYERYGCRVEAASTLVDLRAATIVASPPKSCCSPESRYMPTMVMTLCTMADLPDMGKKRSNSRSSTTNSCMLIGSKVWDNIISRYMLPEDETQTALDTKKSMCVSPSAASASYSKSEGTDR